MLQEKKDWATPRIIARMWHCLDEVCDCWQPLVERITPNRTAGFPWVIRERLWSGTLASEPDEEKIDKLKKELQEEADRRGIPIGK